MRMRALTICQPHAFYVALPDSDPRHKRVENRRRPLFDLQWNQDIAIHAGLSKAWHDTGEFEFEDADLIFGAILAVARCAGWVELTELRHHLMYQGNHWAAWILDHPHTCGPWCLVLDHVRVLAEPIPCLGHQGFFWVEIPDPPDPSDL